jgi:hypothetical protein
MKKNLPHPKPIYSFHCFKLFLSMGRVGLGIGKVQDFPQRSSSRFSKWGFSWNTGKRWQLSSKEAWLVRKGTKETEAILFLLLCLSQHPPTSAIYLPSWSVAVSVSFSRPEWSDVVKPACGRRNNCQELGYLQHAQQKAHALKLQTYPPILPFMVPS